MSNKLIIKMIEWYCDLSQDSYSNPDGVVTYKKKKLREISIYFDFSYFEFITWFIKYRYKSFSGWCDYFLSVDTPNHYPKIKIIQAPVATRKIKIIQKSEVCDFNFNTLFFLYVNGVLFHPALYSISRDPSVDHLLQSH